MPIDQRTLRPKPSGVTPAASWSPSQLGASLALWLDGNDASTLTLNGASVSQWSDRSGNNRHAVQPSAASQPTYSATGWANTQPAVLFSATAGRHMNFSGFAAGTYDLFSVFKHDGVAASTFGFWRNAAASTFLPLAASSSGTGTRLVGTTVDYTVLGYPNGRETAISVPADGESFRQAYWTTCTAANGLLLRFANVPIVNATDIDRIGFLSPAYGIQGPVCEIIAVASSTAVADRQRLEGYLAWKWGLVANLPFGHPYKNSAP